MKAAFLVIHGIGQQRPFETLDAFARGLARATGAERIEHRLLPGPHVDHYVRLASSRGEIDVHEFYWAHLTERRITLREVAEWFAQVARGARRFYGENEALARAYRERRRPYLRFVSAAYEAMALPLRWGGPVLEFAARPFVELVRPLVVGYVGDIAIYTTADLRSRHHETRAQILERGMERLLAVLALDYDRVVIAGHSLGSVIAYDLLNRLNLRANLPRPPKGLDRLQGLATLGSPLDKVAFFFREHVPASQPIRRAIVSHLHSFRTRSWTPGAPDAVANPIERKLDRLRWVNYWNRRDPVSGHLDFYDLVEEDQVHLALRAPYGAAHVAYWTHAPFYDHLVRTYLGWRAPGRHNAAHGGIASTSCEWAAHPAFSRHGRG